MQLFTTLLLAASVGFNAYFFQQAQDTAKTMKGLQQELNKFKSTSHQEPPSPECPSSVVAPPPSFVGPTPAPAMLTDEMARIDYFASLPIKTLQSMGQLFLASKFSEWFLTDQQGKNKKPRYLTHHGYEMISVRVKEHEKQSGQLDKATVKAMVDRLEHAGAVVIPSLVDKEQCRKLAHQVHQDIMNPNTNYTSIRHNEFRKDLPLLLEDDYLQFMQGLLKLLQPVYEATLGKGPLLKEFSTMTTYPGAADQTFHSDSGVKSEEDFSTVAKLYSAFIYLDDVGAETAPLDVVPGTHKNQHLVDKGEFKWADRFMDQNPVIRLAVPQGSMVLYDSRTIHRGSGNHGIMTRPTLMFSMMDSTRRKPKGPTYSLHPQAAKNITLDDIIAGKIPPPLPLQDGYKPHDDNICQTSMTRACANATTQMGGDDQIDDEETRMLTNRLNFYDCVLNPGHDKREPRLDDPEEGEYDPDDYDLLPLDGCTMTSRMERLAGVHIFERNFTAQVTWGKL